MGYEPPKLVKAKPAHVMILGQTMSGKSVLAKTIAQEFVTAGIPVLLFDPLNDMEWPCHFRTDIVEEFLEVAFSEKSCALFIDECSEVMTNGQKANHKIVTRGRHEGHRVFLLSQRSYSAIAPIVRAQCSDLYCFAMGTKDAEELADDWNDKALLQVPDFPAGTYLHKRRLKPAQKYKIFDTE